MPTFAAPANLAKNELQNARIQNLASAPGAPVSGQVYWDTTLGALRVWSGSAWLDLASQIDLATNVNGLDWKASVRAASTANLTLSNTQTVDGVALLAGDRVLVKNQTTASQNGIYAVVSGGAWTRPADATTGTLTSNAAVYVSEGGTQADTQWVLQTDDPITVGTTALTWAQIGAGTSYTAGTGVAIAGNVISVSPTYAGQESITTLGTVTTGTWTATPVAVAYGGTGGNTAAAARTNLGAVGRYSQLVGDGVATSFSIPQSTHGLAVNFNNVVMTFDASTGERVYPNESVNPSTGAVSVAFATAPGTNAYRVVIIGG